MSDIEAIKARLAGLPCPGPWEPLPKIWKSATSDYTLTVYGIEQSAAVYGENTHAIIYAQREGGLLEREAIFIAHAPTDIATLLTDLEREHQGRIDAEERTKLVAATYQAQQQSYRELGAVYSACVEDKQRAEAENADLREKLQKVLADAVRPFPKQRK